MIKIFIVTLSAILLASCKIPHQQENVLIKKCSDGNYVLRRPDGAFVLRHEDYIQDQYELVDEDSIPDVCHRIS